MIRGEARQIDRPEPGHWMMRLAKRAPAVPARIYFVRTWREPDAWPPNLMDRSPFLVAEILGEIVPWSDVWERRGTSISEEEFNYQMALYDWTKRNAPWEPLANPTEPVDLRKLPAITP